MNLEKKSKEVNTMSWINCDIFISFLYFVYFTYDYLYIKL